MPVDIDGFAESIAENDILDEDVLGVCDSRNF